MNDVANQKPAETACDNAEGYLAAHVHFASVIQQSLDRRRKAASALINTMKHLFEVNSILHIRNVSQCSHFVLGTGKKALQIFAAINNLALIRCKLEHFPQALLQSFSRSVYKLIILDCPDDVLHHSPKEHQVNPSGVDNVTRV